MTDPAKPKRSECANRQFSECIRMHKFLPALPPACLVERPLGFGGP
jgi:hypothetical protein